MQQFENRFLFDKGLNKYMQWHVFLGRQCSNIIILLLLSALDRLCVSAINHDSMHMILFCGLLSTNLVNFYDILKTI